MKVLGVGGHAKVVMNAIQQSGAVIHEVYDDDPTLHGTLFYNYKVIDFIKESLAGDAIIAIGSNDSRKKISERVSKCRWRTVVHPKSIVAEDVIIGEGSVIMAGAIIQPGSIIGRHVIVNTGACIDHDCKIGDFVHIAPNCSIAGGVRIGEGAFIGIGSSVIQYKTIGDWSIIGAGSSVISDIPSKCTAVGVPAKLIKSS